jgi:DNA-binding transcriptional LysR family regulator
VRLFNRSTRRMRLTAEGAAFRARAATALRELDEAMAEVGHARDAAVGRVRISVGVSFGRRYLLPLLPALAARHPQLQLEVSLDNRALDLLAEGSRRCSPSGTTLVIGKSCCTTRIDSIWRRVCASPSMRCWKDSRETRICMPRATRCPIRARPEESPQTRAGIRHFGYIRLA